MLPLFKVQQLKFILHYFCSRFFIYCCSFSQHSEIKEKEVGMKKHEENGAKLAMQITALNENLGTMKKEWQSSQRRVSELEKQTDDLRGEIAVLEATVQNNQDERRALLERWLMSSEISLFPCYLIKRLYFTLKKQKSWEKCSYRLSSCLKTNPSNNHIGESNVLCVKSLKWLSVYREGL